MKVEKVCTKGHKLKKQIRFETKDGFYYRRVYRCSCGGIFKGKWH